MKIIHCLNHFLPEQIGGTEIYVLSLAKALSNDYESIIVVPNYGKDENETYYVEDIRVIKYGETSRATRAMIMGKEIPKGLVNFKMVLSEEKPDVVHFHNIGKSIGITVHHLIEARRLELHTLMTMHIAGYTCLSANMTESNNTLPDGIIDIKKYTARNYASKKLSPLKEKVLLGIAMAAYRINYDATNWQSSLGTAIGYPFVIQRMKKDLFSIEGNCDRIVVLTKWYKKILLLNGIKEDKLTYIAQGLPIQDNITRISEQSKQLKLVYIGRIIEEKGLHLILEAVQQLPGGEISLDIYGQLNESVYCKSWKNITSGMSNICWKGILEPSSVVSNLRNYDILCIPSIVSEMSPLVIQEAFAARIAVIASNVYGNAEQIKDGINGWLFKINDYEDLKLKLQMLLENPGMIKGAQKYIPEVRSFSDVGKEYKLLYEEILYSL